MAMTRGDMAAVRELGRVLDDIASTRSADEHVKRLRVDEQIALGAALFGTGRPGVWRSRSVGPLADTATDSLLGVDGSGAGTLGLVLVVDNSQLMALFAIQGNAQITAQLAFSDAVFSTTAGTAGKTNVYWSAGNARYEIENKRGGARSYWVNLWAV